MLYDDDEDYGYGILGAFGQGKLATSKENITRIENRIAQYEKTSKMAKALFDLMNSKLKEVRQLGDYKIYSQVMSMLKAMDTRMRDVAFAAAEEKAALEAIKEADRRETDYIAAPMRARRGKRKSQKVRIINPKLMRNLRKFTR